MDFTREQIREKSLLRTQEILQDPHYKEAQVIYIYRPSNQEIDTEYLIVKALQDNKILASPIYISSQDRVFARIDGNPGFRKGRCNTLEPLYQTKLVIDKPGLRIVPMEKLREDDENGNHYYQNYLANRKDIYTIAIGYKDKDSALLPQTDGRCQQVRLY